MRGHFYRLTAIVLSAIAPLAAPTSLPGKLRVAIARQCIGWHLDAATAGTVPEVAGITRPALIAGQIRQVSVFGQLNRGTRTSLSTKAPLALPLIAKGIKVGMQRYANSAA